MNPKLRTQIPESKPKFHTKGSKPRILNPNLIPRTQTPSPRPRPKPQDSDFKLQSCKPKPTPPPDADRARWLSGLARPAALWMVSSWQALAVGAWQTSQSCAHCPEPSRELRPR